MNYGVKISKFVCFGNWRQIMAKKQAEDTPLLKQYFAVKAQHPEAVLLYRVGDFYETYSDDAVLVSKVLGLVQTKRSMVTKKPCRWPDSRIML